MISKTALAAAGERLRLSEDSLRPIPSLPPLCFFVAGALPIGLVDFAYCTRTTAVSIAIAIFSLAWLVLPKHARKWWPMAIVGAALALLQVHAPWRNYDHALKGDSNPVEIRGIIAGDRILNDELLRPLSATRNVELKLTHIRPSPFDPWQPCRGTVMLRNPSERCQYGSEIFVGGTLRRPWQSTIPGNFGYRDYLKAKGIGHVLDASVIEFRQDEPRGWRAINARFFAAREHLLGRVVRHLDLQGAGSVVAAMTLGFRQSIASEDRQTYLRSGMIHLFAISGLHVGVLYGLMVTILSLLRVPFSSRHLIAPVLLFAYVMACGAPPSAVRAWLMLSIWSLGRASKSPVSAMNATMVAALVLLCYNPYHLFQTGFQFSFAVVLCLIRGWQSSRLILNAVFEHRYWAPVRLQRRFSLAGTAGTWGLRTLLSMLMAWLGSIGLTAYYNGLFLPTAFLSNMLVCSVAWLIIVLSVLKTALSYCFLLPLEQMAAKGLAATVHLLQSVAEFSAEYGYPLTIARPSVGETLVYYLLLAPLFLNLPTPRRLCLSSATLALYLVYLLWAPPVNNGPEPHVTILLPRERSIPVIVVEQRHARQAVVINTGPKAFGSILSGWLSQRGTKAVSQLLLLDNRAEFCGGAGAVLASHHVQFAAVLARDRLHLKKLQEQAWHSDCRWRVYYQTDGFTRNRFTVTRQVKNLATDYRCELKHPDWSLTMVLQSHAPSHATLNMHIQGPDGERHGSWTFTPQTGETVIPF